MDKFDQQKSEALKKYHKAKKDGLVDEQVIPMLEYVNETKDYYTTSSCAGRIVLFWDKGCKLDDDWVAKWHRNVEPDEVLANIKPLPGRVWFRYEPSIFHIVARTIEGAEKIMQCALNAAYRRSGLQVLKEGRYMVEVLSTERVDTPVIEDDKVLVDEDYLRYLIDLANDRHRQGQIKLTRLENELKKII